MVIVIVEPGTSVHEIQTDGGAHPSAIASHAAPPRERRLKKIFRLLTLLLEKVTNMADDQKKLADEVSDLKSNMKDLHTVFSGIQARLDTGLANAGSSGAVDPAILTDLHAVNGDLRSVIDGLGRSVGVTSVDDPVTGAAPVDQAPAIDLGSAPQPVVQPVSSGVAAQFDSSNQAPNAPGGRNSSQLPNFDPSVPETA